MSKQDRLWAFVCAMVDEPTSCTFEELTAELENLIEEKKQEARDDGFDWTGPWGCTPCPCKEDE